MFLIDILVLFLNIELPCTHLPKPYRRVDIYAHVIINDFSDTTMRQASQRLLNRQVFSKVKS